MAGIQAFGAYIPKQKLDRQEISRAWARGGGRGEKAVANFDEDSITMAVEAVVDCLRGREREHIDGLFFASTTAPYGEKLTSTLIATVADLRRDILTADFANSLRAGTIALRSALDAIDSGRAKSILVVAADCRLGAPRSQFEQSFGDGAAALLVGEADGIATIEDSYTVSNEIIDVWRISDDRYVRAWEGRFILTEGYNSTVREAVSTLLQRAGREPKDFSTAVLYAPDVRSHQRLARSLGFDTKTQLQDPLLAAVGDTGAAHCLMMLVAALEDAKPDDRMLVASYGDGSDALMVKVTDGVASVERGRAVSGHLGSSRKIKSYAQYCLFRNVMGSQQHTEVEPPGRPSSATIMWRDRGDVLGLHGSKCRSCSLITYPIQRVCIGCQSKDDYEEVRLSDKGGTVFTFSLDNLAGGMDPPTIQTVVQSEEGKARIYSLMTDVEPDEVKVGMSVEMTFRKMHQGGGFHNYFWKCRPVR